MTELLTAIFKYGLTEQIKREGMSADGLTLKHVELDPITQAMRRMARNLEFDICEMAMTTYLCARVLEVPITAIPIFVTRNFHQWALFHNVNAGIKSPTELSNRRIGVNRGYTVTTGVWLRGILESEYGVDLDSVTWVATDDEHVSSFDAPPNVDYSKQGQPIVDLLLEGDVDVAIGDIRTDAPEIQPLIPDALNVGIAFYKKTGIYPLNHTIVIKNSALDAHPGLATNLFNAFKSSKEAYLEKLAAGGDGSVGDNLAIALGDGIGGDPFPFGVEANRKAVETLVRFSHDQHITPDLPALESLFAAETLDLS